MFTVVVSYAGAGLHGYQAQPGRGGLFPTVEEHVLQAFLAVGEAGVTAHSRAARTDKGVSAASNVAQFICLAMNCQHAELSMRLTAALHARCSQIQILQLVYGVPPWMGSLSHELVPDLLTGQPGVPIGSHSTDNERIPGRGLPSTALLNQSSRQNSSPACPLSGTAWSSQSPQQTKQQTARNACTSRVYEYLLPAWALDSALAIGNAAYVPLKCSSDPSSWPPPSSGSVPSLRPLPTLLASPLGPVLLPSHPAVSLTSPQPHPSPACMAPNDSQTHIIAEGHLPLAGQLHPPTSQLPPPSNQLHPLIAPIKQLSSSPHPSLDLHPSFHHELHVSLNGPPSLASQWHANMLLKVSGSQWKLAPLEQQRLQSLLSLFVGEHSFHNFCSRRAEGGQNPMRTIHRFTCHPLEIGGTMWVRLELEGSSFLMHMIRKMVGLFLAVARGGAVAHCITNALHPRLHVAVPTAPAHGLLLDHVCYQPRPRGASHAWSSSSAGSLQFKTEAIYPAVAAQDPEPMWRFLSGLHDRQFGFSAWPAVAAQQAMEQVQTANRPAKAKQQRGASTAVVIGAQETYGTGRSGWATPSRPWHGHS